MYHVKVSSPASFLIVASMFSKLKGCLSQNKLTVTTIIYLRTQWFHISCPYYLRWEQCCETSEKYTCIFTTRLLLFTKYKIVFMVWRMNTYRYCLYIIVSFLRCASKWPAKEPADNGGEKQTESNVTERSALLKQHSKKQHRLSKPRTTERARCAACAAAEVVFLR